MRARSWRWNIAVTVVVVVGGSLVVALIALMSTRVIELPEMSVFVASLLVSSAVVWVGYWGAKPAGVVHDEDVEEASLPDPRREAE